MDSRESKLHGFDAGVRRAAFCFGLLYWAAVLVFSSILWGAAGTAPMETALDKLAHYTICSLVTFAIAEILGRQRLLAVQTLPCFVLAVLAGPAYHLIDKLSPFVLCVSQSLGWLPIPDRRAAWRLRIHVAPLTCCLARTSSADVSSLRFVHIGCAPLHFRSKTLAPSLGRLRFQLH
jgi:hypothetical protein